MTKTNYMMREMHFMKECILKKKIIMSSYSKNKSV